MKLLFGTGNEAKLSVMKSRLENIGIELIGLNDLRAEGKCIPEILENGNTPLENARIKALAYYEAFHIPVFSCDSGLYFDNVPDEVQPGVHVRNVAGKCLSDEEMIEYYTGLAKKYGNLIAQYRNAICFVMDEEHVYESMDPSVYSEKFILTDKPHSLIREKGFPLDSMSIDMKTNKYYYDLEASELEQFAVEDGVLKFFEKILCFEYKRATIEDIEELVRTRIIVLRAANKLSDDVDMSVVEQESLEYYRRALETGEHIAYLVYDNGKFIGAGGVSFYQVMPTYHNPSGKKAYIMNMYTSPEYRRKGIAFHTLDLLVKAAKNLGVTQIALEATDMGRPLYEKYGFVMMKDEMELK